MPANPVFVAETAGQTLHLWTQEGDRELPLEEARAIVGVGCSESFGVIFMRPTQDLVPGANYELRFADAGQPGLDYVAAKFTAQDRRDQAQIQDVPVTYYRALSIDGCGPAPSVPCSGQAELFVGQHDRASEAFGWLIARAGGRARVTEFGTETSGGYLAIAQTEDEPCVEYELVDRRGVTRKQQTLCEPSKCLELGARAASSCSSFPSPWGQSMWDRVEVGSCDQAADDGEPADPAPDAGPPELAQENAARVAAASCSSSSSATRALPLSYVFLMVLAFARLLRTRVRTARTRA